MQRRCSSSSCCGLESLHPFRPLVPTSDRDKGCVPICPHMFGWLIRWMQGVSHPVRVNQIPRQIPPTPRYLHPWVCPMTCNVWPRVNIIIGIHIACWYSAIRWDCLYSIFHLRLNVDLLILSQALHMSSCTLSCQVSSLHAHTMHLVSWRSQQG